MLVTPDSNGAELFSHRRIPPGSVAIKKELWFGVNMMLPLVTDRERHRDSTHALCWLLFTSAFYSQRPFM